MNHDEVLADVRAIIGELPLTEEDILNGDLVSALDKVDQAGHAPPSSVSSNKPK